MYTRNTVKIKPAKDDKYNELTIIIPAATIGGRSKQHGPTPLLKINNQYLIDIQLGILRKQFPKANIVLIVGQDADKVMDYVDSSIYVVENEKFQESNVIRSIAMGLRVTCSNRILIVYGDLLFNADIFKTTLGTDSLLFIEENPAVSNKIVGCVYNNGIVENLFYNLPNKWRQITYLTGDNLQFYKKQCFNRDKGTFYEFEILNQMIQKGYPFKVTTKKTGISFDIDSSKDLESAKTLWTTL
jgi:NDP-sugar pyrophosphorylase family protein